ncbi:hypothetical protein HOM98_06330 [Candidatus Peregrinibacteria bacterium]|nr:hypothetical protein [Candidatus Peregrinibacteria bacterium]
MIKRFFTKNVAIKLLALGAACLFWFFVLSSENTFYQLPGELTIEPFNVPEGLAVVNELGEAEITIRASQEVYKTLISDNFTVYVDLQGLAAGSKQVDIAVNSKKTDVSVVSVSPESVQVILEELTTKEVPLTYALSGEPAENYTAALTEMPSTTIAISGATSLLSEIETVIATLVLQGDETTDLIRSAEITILDEDGQELTTLESDPASIDLAAQITLLESQKTVGVKVMVESLQTGYLDSIKTTPTTIQIQGDADLLEEIIYLETETLTVPAGEEIYKTTVQLILPEGVSFVDETNTIEVVLSINED